MIDFSRSFHLAYKIYVRKCSGKIVHRMYNPVIDISKFSKTLLLGLRDSDDRSLLIFPKSDNVSYDDYETVSSYLITIPKYIFFPF